MTITILSAVTFFAAALIAFAVGMVVRDLVFGTQRETALEGTLRRLPRVDDMPRGGLTPGFDSWFNRLVYEADVGITPGRAVLLLIFFGVPLAGLLFIATDAPLTALIGLFFGMALPLTVLVFYRWRRMGQIMVQLPDSLDLVARAVRAGESVDQAITLAGQRTPAPLGVELRRTASQMHMGLGLAEATRSLARRVPSVEMKILSTTLSVHRTSGGNLALTLERMAGVIRDRLNYRRQLKATTAAGRFSTILVASAGPLLFAYMFIFNSEYSRRLIEQPMGQMMLAVAVALEIIGLVWVISMLRTDY